MPVNIARSISGARELWGTGGKLGLNPLDRMKYALSWYMSRGFLASLAPAHFILRLPGGIRAPIRPNGVDMRTLAEIFERKLYNLSVTGVKRVLDLGANIGLATLFFSWQFPEAELACVEPSPGNRDMLRETIRLNRIRATVFEGAVGTESGVAELHVGCEPDMFSLTPSQSSAQRLTVRLFAVPELLAKMGWDEIDVLKIDIEGYEKTLLHENNSWLGRVRFIIGEAHGHVGYQIEHVRADLAPFGFQVTQKSSDARYGLTVFEAARGENPPDSANPPSDTRTLP